MKVFRACPVVCAPRGRDASTCIDCDSIGCYMNKLYIQTRQCAGHRERAGLGNGLVCLLPCPALPFPSVLPSLCIITCSISLLTAVHLTFFVVVVFVLGMLCTTASTFCTCLSVTSNKTQLVATRKGEKNSFTFAPYLT